MPLSKGKHGAELNLAVPHRRRAPHRAGHACRVSILGIVAFVHVASADPNMATLCQLGCFCVPIVAPRL